MIRSALKEDLLQSLRTCQPCNRLATVVNRLSIDTGKTRYTSAEVLWIVQMIAEAQEPAGTERGGKRR